MNPLILVAPAAEVTRRPTGDPPGDPPGDFAPVIGAALAQGAQAPPKGSADGARTATAEGADPETADAGTGQAETAGDVEQPSVAVTGEVGQVSAPAAAASATELPLVQTAAAADTPASSAAPTVSDAPTVPAQPLVAGALPLQETQASEQADTAPAAPVKASPGQLLHEPVADAAPAADGTVPLAADTEELPQTALPKASAAPLDPARIPVQAEVKHHDQPPSDRHQQQQPDRGAVPAPVRQADAAAETARPVNVERTHVPATHATHVARTEPVATTGEIAQPQPVAATAQQTVASERAALTETPVRAHAQLAQLAETARTVVRMAAREGAAQAHITLHPAELGEVEIRLRYHAGGISADVLADSQAAAQVLQHASADLKRSLEAQGLVVHDLDVRHGEQEKRRAHEQHQGRGHRHAHAFEDSDHTTIDTSSLSLGSGVDVLA